MKQSANIPEGFRYKLISDWPELAQNKRAVRCVWFTLSVRRSSASWGTVSGMFCHFGLDVCVCVKVFVPHIRSESKGADTQVQALRC